ncbi:MAG: hypothetical protein HY690_12265 [Chloroflexi bacterium]|nr:hypothetical protein [Chloroflexota bacterium]
MKDPLDSKERPYEILGVGRNATLAEIDAAYARLTAEHPARRQELTQAWQRLHRPETRLEEDFWYYPVGDAEHERDGGAELQVELQWDPALPAVEIDLAFTDLAEGRYRADFRPLEFRAMKLAHLDRYDAQPKTLFRPAFDR